MGPTYFEENPHSHKIGIGWEFRYRLASDSLVQFAIKHGISRESLNIPLILKHYAIISYQTPPKWLKTLLKTLKRNNVVVFEYYFKKYIGQYVGNLQYNIIGKNIVSIAKYIEIYQIHQAIHNKKWENLSEQIDKIIS